MASAHKIAEPIVRFLSMEALALRDAEALGAHTKTTLLELLRFAGDASWFWRIFWFPFLRLFFPT
jgi:hypothetical protein